jgi:YD repeat-containing protein
MRGYVMVRAILAATCVMAAGVATATDFSRTEVIEYYDDAGNWVLGQTKKITVDGVVSDEVGYTSKAQPGVIKSFGAVLQVLTYNADGTVATLADGKGNTTTAGDWHRGIPRAVGNADGTGRAAEVDDLGLITSVTDESGFTTRYSYDAMGRLAGTIYPNETDLAYNALSVTFQQVGTEERGLPAGHWTQVQRLGNQQITTYFDALWRPVLEERMDTGAVNGSTSQVVKRYDAMGRVIFQSYHARGVTSYLSTLPGSWTEYDPLGRVISVARDSESGPLTTSTQYLSGNRVVITDPMGHQTTTTFQAFDAPSYEHPTLIQASQGVRTAINRDVFGKPHAITRNSL